jgi:mono/diheme cytochrome c family protein
MKQNVVAGILGVVMFSSVLATAAFAGGPPKNPPKKKPPVKGKTKPKPKPTEKKDDGKALIAAGLKVYEANGCGGCHAIAGKGGMTAPELTKVAADSKHNLKWLEESIVNPKADHPDSTMPAYEELAAKDLKALVAYLASLK